MLPTGSFVGCGDSAVEHQEIRSSQELRGHYTYFLLAIGRGRLTSASGIGTLAYDPVGRLARTSAASVTKFGYDGQTMIVEYSATNTLLRRYVHGPGVDEPLVWYEGSGTGDKRWLHADERGSGLPRYQIAMISTSVTSWAVMVALIDHPTTRREKRSITAATWSHPSAVQI